MRIQRQDPILLKFVDALAGLGLSPRPSVGANENVDLTVMPGEIHTVLGENGDGKSTLMKMIYGVVKPDRGEMRWEGQPVVVANAVHARQPGISMVFQHFSLFETLSVIENVALALPGRADLTALRAGSRRCRRSTGCRSIRAAPCTRRRSASGSASKSRAVSRRRRSP